MEKNKQKTIREELILEQYSQAHDQRARDSALQFQLLAIGNTVIGGLFLAIFSVNTELLDLASLSNYPSNVFHSRDLISLILSLVAVLFAFFISLAYLKQLYFEELYIRTIERIENENHVKHVQYDTYGEAKGGKYYVNFQPKKGRLVSFSFNTIMIYPFGIYLISAVISFGYFGVRLTENTNFIYVAILLLPFLYIFTSILNLIRPQFLKQTIDLSEDDNLVD